MIEITVKGIVKAFEKDTNLLDGISFEINSGERVGLMGKNGAGKTTLFRMLTGELLPDEGEISMAAGTRIGLISQIPYYPAGWTVEQVLRSAFAELDRIRDQMHQLEQQMTASAPQTLLKQYDALQIRYQSGGGYEMDMETDKICNGLDIPQNMRQTAFDRLSGGEKTRVNLARLLLEKTDVLLLDEPTNHLDMKSVEWLEEYLQKFKGTVLTISHDRYFLDRVVQRIIEIVDGKAAFYQGNYSFYIEEKQARFDLQLKQYEQEQAKLQQLGYTLERMKGWGINNRTLYRRAMSIQHRMDRIAKTEKPKTEKVLHARFGERDFRGDWVMAVQNLSKSFGDRVLFSDVELTVGGDERIALLGDNGTGKSTFLKILLGEETPSGGKIKFGPSVKMGYLPQILHFDHPERTLLDTMLYETKCTVQSARDRLGSFLFQGEDVFKVVGTILDEPTNHLDIPSREWMEAAVEEFEGTLLFVSHDRYFVDHFATRIWELDKQQIQDYPFGYQKYRAIKEREAVQKPAAVPAQPKAKKEKPRNARDLEKQIAKLEREIEKQEQLVASYEPQIAAAATDYQELTRLLEEKSTAEAQLEALYNQWEQCSAELGG